jgi:hypothetical protein
MFSSLVLSGKFEEEIGGVLRDRGLREHRENPERTFGMMKEVQTYLTKAKLSGNRCTLIVMNLGDIQNGLCHYRDGYSLCGYCEDLY